MVEARIIGIGTAVPDLSYTQTHLFEQVLKPYFTQNQDRAERIFANAGIQFRHLAVHPDFYKEERTTEARNAVYMREAAALGKQAISRCLEDAGLGSGDVDDFIVISCTGIDTPGLDLQLAGALGMRPDVQRSTILGMGCYAALPGLLRAQQAAIARPGRNSLVLAVEICSLHFQPEDSSLENAVSTALFADGAAAVLVSSRAPVDAAPHPRLVEFATYCDYQTLDQMAFHLTDHGFRMRLSAYVPKILSARIEDFVDGLLVKQGIARNDVQVWGVHPGSAKILDYTRERLGLDLHALDCSYATLQEFGNMSSPTVLFILEKIQKEERPQPGTYGVLMAFGPGLTLEGALVQW